VTAIQAADKPAPRWYASWPRELDKVAIWLTGNAAEWQTRQAKRFAADRLSEKVAA